MSFIHELLLNPIAKIAIGLVIFLLGLSFAWKGWTGCVLGRFNYWSGFLPITMISPWLTHLPKGERSLVKTREGMLAHVFLGPSFFFCSVLFLCAGADLLGLPGTNTLNSVINGFDNNKPVAVSFDSTSGRYTFPLLTKAGGTLYKKFFKTKIDESHDLIGRPIEQMLPEQTTTIDGAAIKAKDGGR
jgi:hypothetical protein